MILGPAVQLVTLALELHGLTLDNSHSFSNPPTQDTTVQYPNKETLRFFFVTFAKERLVVFTFYILIGVNNTFTSPLYI